MSDVLGYMILHYGKEYLEVALKSVAPFCDKVIVLYSATPSMGFTTRQRCPDKEQELKRIALASGGNIVWHKVKAKTLETDHRKAVNQFILPRHKILVATDADEVWEEKSLLGALQAARDNPGIKTFGISGYLNFWKSFNNVCVDRFTPIRITNISAKTGMLVIPATIYHFSCAQRDEVMKYKYRVSGHRNEIRGNWLEIFRSWKQGDRFLHPASKEIWEDAVPFEKESLPEALRKHVNFGKEVI